MAAIALAQGLVIAFLSKKPQEAVEKTFRNRVIPSPFALRSRTALNEVKGLRVIGESRSEVAATTVFYLSWALLTGPSE